MHPPVQSFQDFPSINFDPVTIKKVEIYLPFLMRSGNATYSRVAYSPRDLNKIARKKNFSELSGWISWRSGDNAESHD
jgi:hypothetical protein